MTNENDSTVVTQLPHYEYVDEDGNTWVGAVQPKKKKEVNFFGGYDSSRMPRITTRTRTETGKPVDEEIYNQRLDALKKVESQETKNFLKSEGWTDERISNLISHHRKELENTNREKRIITTPSGVEIPVHAGINIGDRTRLSGHAHIGVGGYGLQMGGEKPWGINLNHLTDSGHGLSFGVDNSGLTAGVDHNYGKDANIKFVSKLGMGGGVYNGINANIKFGGGKGLNFEFDPKEFLSQGAIGALIAAASWGFGKIATKYKNDQLHGELQKNPPPLLKQAWEIGLKNLSDDDVFKLVESVEEAKREIANGIFSKGGDKDDVKDNGAYHYFDQELKHFYQERIRRGKKRWADAYVKNWAEGKHPSYEKFLREKLEGDLQNPDVKKYIGEPHWNNPNDWGMVDRAKNWIHNWGATPNRLDAWHNQFLVEHKQNVENAFNQNIDELSKGHPDGFKEYLRNKFNLYSLTESTPEIIHDMFAGLRNNGEIEKFRGNFDTEEAAKVLENERIKNSEEAKKEFERWLTSATYYDGNKTKEEYKNFLRSHFDNEIFEHSNKNDTRKMLEDWENKAGGFANIRGNFRAKQAHDFLEDKLNEATSSDDEIDRDDFKNYLRSTHNIVAQKFDSRDQAEKRWDDFIKSGEFAKARDTFRNIKYDDDYQNRLERERDERDNPQIPFSFNQQSQSPSVSQPQNETTDDVDIARNERQVRNFNWNKFNPIPKLSSYYGRMRNYYRSNNSNENDDVDLRRLQNQHGKLVQAFTIPKHYPTEYLEDKPDDTFQELTTKARLRLLQDARRYYPTQREKLKVSKPPEMKMRDMINLQRNEI